MGPNDYPTSPNDEVPDTERAPEPFGGGGEDSIDYYDSYAFLDDPISSENPLSE